MADRKKNSTPMNTTMIAGRNAVTEAIRSGRDIAEVYLAERGKGQAASILTSCEKAHIPVRFVTREDLDEWLPGKKHQGVAAKVAAYAYGEVADILASAKERGEDPLVILLDGIEDPHNLGAILRTAECVGAHGVVVKKHGGVGLTDTVAKSSAGAIEYVPVAQVTNMSKTIDGLKDQGLWIAACDMDGADYTKVDLKGPLAIVIGNEGSGISRLVKEKCDFTVSIPLKGRIDSLNASNAAAVILYEVLRQREQQ